MDWSLIALGLPDLSTVGYILQVAFGLGMVIFVHELGHFAVAKACGVKCEKFYLGFDIAGLKIWKCRWGETEYGIGILPLGGYVKMLGQEDNPAKLQEEIDRAKQAAGTPSPGDAADNGECRCDAASPAQDPGAAHPAEANDALYNPRSYLAKSVPQRMAIISAGVIMNFLFAIVTGAIAYKLGVFHQSCGVGGVAPGSSAWQNRLEAGDRIVAIDGKPVRRFEDLLYKVTVGDVENGVDLAIERPGVPDPFTLRVIPNPTKPVPTIGIATPRTTSLSEKLPTIPGTAAAKASAAFEGGDKVVAIDGRPVHNFADIARQFALNPSKTLRVTVDRMPTSADAAPIENPGAKPTQLSIDVPPMPRKTLGIVMPMGPITVIQKDSPAERAGLKPGDVIVAVDDRPNPDATFFPDQMERLAEQKKTVRLSVQRPGRKEPLVVELSPQLSRLWVTTPLTLASPMAASAVGIAYFIPNRIASIEPGSPAAAAGIQSDQTILIATLVPPEKSEYEALGLTPHLDALALRNIEANFKEPGVQWAAFAQVMDDCVQGYRVELTFESGKVKLEPVDAKDAFQIDRGLMFGVDGFRLKASSTLDAVALGAEATCEATTMVFRFLRKLPSRLRAVGGPLTILQGAYYKATSGWSDFLMFLTLIGANLAVINFLPIPLLDGGHMVFLAYEGITRKPPNERIQLILSYVGLLLLLALMIWVFGLDLGFISRH